MTEGAIGERRTLERLVRRPMALPAPTLVVLAAGGSSRHGGTPKALLPIGGQTALERILSVADESGITERLVVVGGHAKEIRRALPNAGVHWVENPVWELGRTGSVQAALSEAGETSSVLLWPVDHPWAEANTVGLLLRRSMHDSLAAWLIPTFRGRGGHPVLIRRPMFPWIDSLGPDESMRALFPRLGVQVARLPVADPGVVDSTDTPEEYYAVLARRREEAPPSWTVD